MARELVLRADAGPDIGVGHVLRCVALAHAWRARGGEVTFLTACADPRARARVEAVGRVIDVHDVHPDPRDAARVVTWLGDHAGASAVVDGYHFDQSFQERVRVAASGLLVLDDIAHLPAYSADLILNQNLGARAERYPRDARLLLGPTFAMLRAEFLRHGRPDARATPERARRVLVTFGGSDTGGTTTLACRALAALAEPDLHARVLLGAGGSSAALEEVVRASATRIELVGATDDMPSLMAWADAAISAGGTTCWELAFSGVPSIAVTLADNQRGNVLGLARAGVMLDAGEGDALTVESLAGMLRGLLAASGERRDMSRRGRELVDGRGAERVADALLDVGAR